MKNVPPKFNLQENLYNLKKLNKGSFIDFTLPFYTEGGIGFLMKRQTKDKDLFLFVSVFTWQLWICLFLAVIVTALLIFLFDKSYPLTQKNPSKHHNHYNLGDSFW